MTQQATVSTRRIRADALAREAEDTADRLAQMPGRVLRLAEAVQAAERLAREHREGPLAEARCGLLDALVALADSVPEEAREEADEATRLAALARHVEAEGGALRTAADTLCRAEEAAEALDEAIAAREGEHQAALDEFAALRHLAELQAALLRLYAAGPNDA